MPLKKTEIERFQKRLEQMREQLVGTIRDVNKDVKSEEEKKGYSQHQADEGTDTFNRTVSLEVSSKELDLLREIDRALDKIKEGTYGICEVSGEEIPLARLEVIPYARMTVQAQQRMEKGLL